MARDDVLEAENLGCFQPRCSRRIQELFLTTTVQQALLVSLLQCLCSEINFSLLIVFAVAAAIWKREYC